MSCDGCGRKKEERTNPCPVCNGSAVQIIEGRNEIDKDGEERPILFECPACHGKAFYGNGIL